MNTLKDTHELNLPELGWVKAREITSMANTRTRKFAVPRLDIIPDGSDWAGKTVEVRGPKMEGQWVIAHNFLPTTATNPDDRFEYIVDLEPAPTP